MHSESQRKKVKLPEKFISTFEHKPRRKRNHKTFMEKVSSHGTYRIAGTFSGKAVTNPIL